MGKATKALAERAHLTAPKGRYCNFCGSPDIFGQTRDNSWICMECAIDEDFCEVCGTVRAYEGQPEDEILHYDEDCFK